MIPAYEYLEIFARAHGYSVMAGQKGNRLSWLCMTGPGNNAVQQDGCIVTHSMFSLRPALRKTRDFIRDFSFEEPKAWTRDRWQKTMNEVASRIFHKVTLDESR